MAMLKVVDIGEVMNEQIHIDDYTVSVEWNPFSDDDFYWRTGDMVKSLFEIAVEGFSHKFRSINLITADFVRVLPEEEPHIRNRDMPKQFGQLICDTANWRPSPYRNATNALFHVELGAAYLRIVFQLRHEISKCIFTHNVNYGINDEGFICAIELINLTMENMDHVRWKFKDALRFNAK